jgi:beta-galactosidase
MNAFAPTRFFLGLIAVGFTLATSVNAQPFTQSLAGHWRFLLDPHDLGVADKYFNRNLSQYVQLPGILQAQGFGDEISTNTPWVLSLYDRLWFEREDYQAHTQPGKVRVPFVSQPTRHYLGAAWYQRDIEIPQEWEGRRVVLFLERTRWETRAWLNDKLIGTNNSLCTPHEFDFGIVPPGKHRITVRVDNRMLLNYRPDAHAVSDSLGSTWNGIVGKIELRNTPPVWIEEVQVKPINDNRDLEIKMRVGNATGRNAKAAYNATIMPHERADIGLPDKSLDDGLLDVPPGGAWVEFKTWLYPQTPVWDEFHTDLQQLHVSLSSRSHRDSRWVKFGLRDITTSGQEFIINGRPTMMRGTHHGGDFPLTGYPSCDEDYWRKLFRTCKKWGLNHVRFHSFCPPEAAFIAADEIGIYLQPEPGMWNEISPGTPMEKFLYEETERMIKYYGNHPSFVLLSPSNEPKGRWKESLPKWVSHFRERDPRRLYTTGTGWSLIDEPQPVADKVDYLAVHRIGLNMMRGNSAWFGRDYSRSMNTVDVPNIVHENGQWCAYPDFDVIKKFTGFIRPENFEIFRDSAAKTGVLEYNKQFAHASGRFQLACYKEELEAIFRSPGLGGFQLLDLHDYIGQGTALVGLLDPFWEEKSYVKAAEWRQFCSETVPLVRLTKRVFTTADQFDPDIEVTHYGQAPLTNSALFWWVTDKNQRVVAQGELPPARLALGRNPALGKAIMDLAKLTAPAEYKLNVATEAKRQTSEMRSPNRLLTSAATNEWNFWLYPAEVSTEAPTNVLVTSSWSEAEAKLAAGGNVLFLPSPADLDWSSPPLDNLPVFWNRLMSPQWGRMLGLWCDTSHPALAGFPTEAHCDWQWTQITKGTRAVNIGKLVAAGILPAVEPGFQPGGPNSRNGEDLSSSHAPKPSSANPGGRMPSSTAGKMPAATVTPIVAAIDDWNRNWKLAPIFEAKVGKGKLLVCSFDLATKLDERIVARQLRRSLLDYVSSEKFQPAVVVSPEQLRALWFDSLVMHKLGATVTTSSGSGREAIDGDPNTFWTAGGRGRGADGRSHPHTLTITFSNAVAMNGVTLMNRQNDRDHLGDIRDYTIELSHDGQTWRPVVTDKLPSTWSPQTVSFKQTETAAHLRLTAVSGYGADASTALAEIAVLYAGPPLPENSAATIEYRRVRSTATDVDEGPATEATTKPTP